MGRWIIVLIFILISIGSHSFKPLLGGEFSIEGKVNSFVSKSATSESFDFMIDKPFRGKIRLSHQLATIHIQPGERWRFDVVLKPKHGLANPGCFNAEQLFLTRGITGSGRVKLQSHPVKLSSSLFNIDFFRQILYEKFQSLIGKSSVFGPVVALCIGINQDLTADQWQIMRQTGTSHLFAISGLHVGLVAGLAYQVVQLFSRFFPQLLLYIPKQQMACIGGLLIGSVYSLLAGMAVSTERAMIMLGVASLPLIFRKHVTGWQIFTFALVLVLLLNPWQIYSISFYLSFGAVGFLFYAGNTKDKTLWQKWGRAQCVCFVGLSPLCAFFFQQFSVVSLLANIIAIPFVSVVTVPLCLLGMIFVIVAPNLAELFLEISAWSLEGLFLFLKFCSQLPLNSVVWVIPHLWQLIFAMMGSVIVLTDKLKLWRALGGILFLPSLLIYRPHPTIGALWVTVLDVDQGLATVIRTEHHTLVFDTGAKNFKSDMGQSVLIPWLRYQGISKIDALVVSHGDNDHIGGAASLLKVMPTDTIYTSVPDKLPLAKYCIAGQSWSWDQVVFTMLGPVNYQHHNTNDNSCVLKVSGKYGSLLMTGDIEKTAESVLVEKQASRLQSDVIVVPHHGSKTSSSEGFLKTVKPKFGIFSYGFLNRYHHPSSEVVLRYGQHGAKVLDTVSRGAITLKLDEQLSVETYRKP